MAEEIAVENGRIFNFEGLVTLILDWVILHTVVHHPSTSIYTPNFTEVEESKVTGDSTKAPILITVANVPFFVSSYTAQYTKIS